jgi:hypothetical protein
MNGMNGMKSAKNGLVGASNGQTGAKNGLRTRRKRASAIPLPGAKNRLRTRRKWVFGEFFIPFLVFDSLTNGSLPLYI